MIDPDQHAEQRNLVESILRSIPGFRGYLEKEDRRQSDYLARTWLADQLDGAKRGLDDAMRGLIDAGLLDELARLEQARTRLDWLVSRLRAAVRGYSGVFDYVKVRRDVLEQVYQHDMSLINEVEVLARSIRELPADKRAPAEVASDLLLRIERVERDFAQRSELLKGLQP